MMLILLPIMEHHVCTILRAELCWCKLKQLLQQTQAVAMGFLRQKKIDVEGVNEWLK